ncbi:MAG TPA: hypothetical protein DCM05_00470 [Elusimicrobia bacterium]|nr:hypothetical protein [Elusimicrobiota bacterium]
MPELGHEDLCVLFHAGELPPDEAAAFEKHLPSCPACREALEALRGASQAAAMVLPEPPKGLGALAAAAVLLQDRPRSLRPLGFALAFAALALALYVASPKREEHSLKWTNGIESDLARVETDLGRLSQEIALGADPAELDEDLDGLEESARSLKRQLSRS